MSHVPPATRMERRTARSKRFHELDGLRAIAVLMVLVGHFTLTYDDLYQDRAHASPFQFRYGLFGVQLFFLVSGYVILMSAERVRRASDFVITRFARLFPVYWIAVTWSILIAVTLKPLDVATTWRDRLLNYTMMQRWIGAAHVDSVYWTLAIEIQFYVLVFCLLLVTRCRLKTKWVVAAAGSWLLASFLTAFFFGVQARGHGLSATPSPYKEIFNLVLTEYAPLFCTGMFAFMARRGQKGAWWASVGCALLASYVAFAMHESKPGIVVGLLCTLFLVVCALPSVPLLRWPPLQWIGRISYSLYLVHNVTGIAIIHALVPYVGRVPAMVIAFVVTCGLARVLYQIGEVWAADRARTRLRTIRDRMAPPRTPSIRDREAIS